VGEPLHHARARELDPAVARAFAMTLSRAATPSTCSTSHALRAPVSTSAERAEAIARAASPRAGSCSGRNVTRLSPLFAM